MCGLPPQVLGLSSVHGHPVHFKSSHWHLSRRYGVPLLPVQEVRARCVCNCLIILHFRFQFHPWELSIHIRIHGGTVTILQQPLEVRIIFGHLICPLVWFPSSVSEPEHPALSLLFADPDHLLNDQVWHWHRCERSPLQYAAHVQAEELYTSLQIPRGT